MHGIGGEGEDCGDNDAQIGRGQQLGQWPLQKG
jgi:hypothetical protein